jgi:hypothetical protein
MVNRIGQLAESPEIASHFAAIASGRWQTFEI